ncbi:outer membrane protein OmpK [Stutzerimonas tarimensis]|uniref:Outer membrane protein OmpK n=1 Tax=Stutzerimonas tarimensis TaxID=1507735 RepID=A0ABV7T161_9GAMM
MKRLFCTSALAAGLAFCGSTLASPMLWHNNSLTYLYGQHYKVDAGHIQQTVTFEHASGWTWGDVFTFVDYKWYNGAETANRGRGRTYYGEFSPRLSLGKTTGRDMSFGPVKDVLIAFTYERGETSDFGVANQNYLLGPAVDLAVPGFDRLAINTYYRKPDGVRGQAAGQWQITPTWAMTFPVGKSDILFDGYIDWVINDVGSPNRGDYVAKNLHINPQLKYDLGKALDWKPKTLYVGIEYDYWKNKYGIDNDAVPFDTDQNTFSWIVKAHF